VAKGTIPTRALSAELSATALVFDVKVSDAASVCCAVFTNVGGAAARRKSTVSSFVGSKGSHFGKVSGGTALGSMKFWHNIKVPLGDAPQEAANTLFPHCEPLGRKSIAKWFRYDVNHPQSFDPVGAIPRSW